MSPSRIPQRTRNRPNTGISQQSRLRRSPPIHTTGAIDTRILAGSSDLIGDSEAFNRPMGRMGTPTEIANGILFLASYESSYMTGTELIIDGDKLYGQWRLADTPYGMRGDWAVVTLKRS